MSESGKNMKPGESRASGSSGFIRILEGQAAGITCTAVTPLVLAAAGADHWFRCAGREAGGLPRRRRWWSRFPVYGRLQRFRVGGLSLRLFQLCDPLLQGGDLIVPITPVGLRFSPRLRNVRQQKDNQDARQLEKETEKKAEPERCLPIRKHRGAREKRYSFGYAVFLILALMK